MFTPEVIEKLGNYIYFLIDPRDDSIFYIGKGTGNRVFEHMEEYNRRHGHAARSSLKLNTIEEIVGSGHKIKYIIHRHNIPDHSVYEVEAALIDAFPQLTNLQRGHGSDERGPMTHDEIIIKYGLPEINWQPEEKLLLININNLKQPASINEIYEQVRLFWPINQSRAEKTDFVLAVVEGVVVGAFKWHDWLDATHDNFPDRIRKENEQPKKKGFIGEPAPPEIWEKFVGEYGKRISIDEMKHVRHPLRYWPN